MHFVTRHSPKVIYTREFPLQIDTNLSCRFWKLHLDKIKTFGKNPSTNPKDFDNSAMGLSLWEGGVTDEPGEVRTQEAGAVLCLQGWQAETRGDQVSWEVSCPGQHADGGAKGQKPGWDMSHQPCAGHPSFSPGSFPHKDLGAVVSKQDQLLCLIFPARQSGNAYIYLHPLTYAYKIVWTRRRDILRQLDWAICLKFLGILEDKCLISM